MNKSILSKLTFDNVQHNTILPTPYSDNNKYTNLVWYRQSSPTITVSNNIHILNITNLNYRLATNNFINSSAEFLRNDFEIDINIRILTLYSQNGFFGVGNGWLKFIIKNTFIGGLSIISSNNDTLDFNYKFEIDVDYNIIITFVDNRYRLVINGEIIGYIDSTQFFKNIPAMTSMPFVLGASLNTANVAENLANGLIWNLNISYGPGVKNEDATHLTKYGKNLLSRLNFDNIQDQPTAKNFKPNLESIYSAVAWDYDNTKVNKYNVNTTFAINIDTNFTALIKLSNNKNRTDVGLISYGNYKVTYNYISVGEPEPIVVVDAFTKSALDFENGLADKVTSTNWSLGNSAKVQNVNKIYGDYSLETKLNGDDIQTPANLITGNGTPYTVEYHFLYKGKWTPAPVWDAPIFTRYTAGDIGNYLNTSTYNISFHSVEMGLNNSSVIFGKSKLKPNEINKVTMSYDGASIRMFINDKLDNTLGTNVGFITRGNQPYRFFSRFADDQSTNAFTSTFGLLDNINIFDGVAKKVRDYDQYEDNLIVDLTFDGENNSTKIVDNGTLKSTWTVTGNAKISTDQKFDGFSSLFYTGGQFFTPISKEYFTINQNEDVTLNLDYYCTDSSNNTKGLIQLFKGASDRIAFYLWNPNRLRIYFDGSVLSDITLPYDTTNKWVRYRVIISNNNWYIYANNILVGSFYNEKKWSGDFKVFLGESGSGTEKFSGYFKNFKIYKGVAVIPENPTGKIQLDFDNNLNDNYNNSTWTHNGVTFDQVNSVKGYSCYFNGVSTIKSLVNESLNYEQNNFKMSFDIKLTSFTNVWNDFITSGIAGSASAFAYNKDTKVTRLRIDGTNYIDIPSNMLLNNYYNTQLFKVKSSILYYINDTIQGCFNTDQPVNFNRANQTTIGGLDYNNNENIVGYIDNFKSIKEDLVNLNTIDKPAVHLPLETNAINTGFTPLTINAVGSPVYHVVDNKKCAEFIAGRYISINDHNIFKMGIESDFYFECMFYTSYRHTNGFGQTLINNGTDNQSNGGMWFQINTTQQSDTGHISIAFNNQTLATTSEPTVLSAWNKLVFKRKNKEIFLILNDVITKVPNFDVHFSKGGSFTIGQVIGASTNATFDGQICDIKMFVGTSEIPETYNDKKVLDLTFEPTRKSYLFKDKNNKCIIHPVNITQRDYQDSKYCCTFNGVDQYLELGKNDLFNFGLDDFVISMSFKIQDYINGTNSYFLLHSGGTTLTNERLLIAVAGTQAGTESKKIHFITTYNNVTQSLFGDEVPLNQINNLIIYRTNGVLYLNFNGNVVSKDFNYPINGNISDNTYIGYRKYTSTTFFKGQIYSLKVLRNTNDLTLLDEVGSIFEESFTLSNGTDSQTFINDVKKDNHNVRFIKDIDKTKLIIDGEFIEVPSVENTSTELKLFENYNSEVKDVKLYNTVFEDEDVFLGNEPIDTVFGEIEYNEESEYELEIPEGDYTLKGFIEGYTDRDFFIYNTVLEYEIYRGTEYYDVNFMDEYSFEDYEINDLVTGAKYPVLKHEMIRGFISGTVNLKGCGVAAKDMKVYCYRDDTHRLIGVYDVDADGKYNIPNLDVNSKYDIIFKDETRKIKDQISNYRTPKVY